MPAVQVNRARVALTSLVLFVCSLFLTAYSAKNPAITRLGSAIISEILSPVEATAHYVHSSVSGLWDGYFALVGVREENRSLEERVAALQSENSRLIELDQENSRLRGLLAVTGDDQLAGVSARIIGYDPSNWSQTVALDRGTIDGVTVGSAVVSTHGVVGQVISTGLKSSRALLVIDHGSGVDAIIQDSRARGIVEGWGAAELRWRFVSLEEAVRVGDRVITSGLDGVYPKGLLIGVVSRVDDSGRGLFREIGLKPAVSFTKLENVFVITGSDVSAARESAPAGVTGVKKR